MKKMAMALEALVRFILAVILLSGGAFCMFGLIASFEPGNGWWWPVAYLVGAGGCLAGAMYLLFGRKIKARRSELKAEKAFPEPNVSPEKDFRGTFKVTMEKYQAVEALRVSLLWVVSAMAVACIILAAYYEPARTVGIAAFVPCALMFLLLGLIPSPTHKMKCPACTKPVYKSLGDHCPECGGRNLRPACFPKVPHPQCNDCGKILSSGGMGQSYESRFCSHCGVLLDSGT